LPLALQQQLLPLLLLCLCLPTDPCEIEGVAARGQEEQEEASHCATEE
jgi:hypothetical protein